MHGIFASLPYSGNFLSVYGNIYTADYDTLSFFYSVQSGMTMPIGGDGISKTLYSGLGQAGPSLAVKYLSLNVVSLIA
jgi:hypothetical protein